MMSKHNIEKLALILVDYSTRVKDGDRVAIITSTVAEPLIQELYGLILERGGYPHILMETSDQEEVFYAHAKDQQLSFVSPFYKMAYEEFDVLLKVRAETNTRALSHVDPYRLALRQKYLSPLLEAQMRRGADQSLRWLATLYPTRAYAMEAEMGFEAYCDFFFRACHADEGTSDPVAFWRNIHEVQRRYIERFEQHGQVEIRGANVDLNLSIKGRKLINASGQINLPDGEIYTGPVEDSVNGWVRFTYPSIYQNRLVEGVELRFEEGRVVKATAAKNQDLLLKMLDIDPGARYVGEFAIGTNYEINRFTKNILLDEKIGGSFHLALGAGYPETGSLNQSVIHWDMICDLKQDSEIRVDRELVYKNGQFIL